jgi:hypothetical protein
MIRRAGDSVNVEVHFGAMIISCAIAVSSEA